MRVFLDTNVWIAGFIARGTCSDLIEHLDSYHDILTSQWILDEIQDVLSEKFGYAPNRVDRVEELIHSMAEEVESRGEPPDVSGDPDDNHVLLGAISGSADVLVTGDDDLLTLENHENTPIIPPNQFWEFETR